MKKIIFFLAYVFQTTKALRLITLICSLFFVFLVLGLAATDHLIITKQNCILWALFPVIIYSVLSFLSFFFSTIDIDWHHNYLYLANDCDGDTIPSNIIGAFFIVIYSIGMFWPLLNGMGRIIIICGTAIIYSGLWLGTLILASEISENVQFSEEFKEKQKKDVLKIA